MGRATRIGAMLAGLSLICGASAVAARPSTRRHHVYARAHPTVDAVELATLAPLSYRSTAEQTYGDAVFARARVQRDYRRDELSGVPDAPVPCDPRLPTSEAYLCVNAPRRIGYGQHYAYTPASTTAPQNVGTDPNEQTSLLSPMTSFFYAANALRFDPH